MNGVCHFTELCKCGSGLGVVFETNKCPKCLGLRRRLPASDSSDSVPQGKPPARPSLSYGKTNASPPMGSMNGVCHFTELCKCGSGLGVVFETKKCPKCLGLRRRLAALSMPSK